MAESGSGDVPPRKKFKRASCSDIIPPEKKHLLDKALKALEDDITFSFTLLKIIYSNAEKCVSFSESFLDVQRSTDQQHPNEGTKVHSFAGVFANGIKILKLYLEDPENVPEDKAMRIALQRLKDTILNIEDIEQSLAKVTRMWETSWTISLVHHLLKELSVNKQYIVDTNSKFKRELCPCCDERIQNYGHYGDCSLGHGAVWHGSVDILLGPQPDVAVYVQDPEDTQSTDGNLSSFEDKDLIVDRSQIIAETIVFAFLQKKHNAAFANYLIPTIAISKKDVLFHFYDPEHDILLESPSFDIFYYNSQQLYYPTVLALWFTLNYKTFCTGITRGMKEQNFTADFLSNKSNEIKAIYQDGLHFRDCRIGFYRSTYHTPRQHSEWILDKSEPYKGESAS